MDDRTLAQERALGFTPALEPIFPGLDLARDLVLERGSGGRDLKLVRGVDALAQDLSIAFTTALGVDVFDTNLGFDGLNALVEATPSVLTRERIRVAVIKLLQREPRVRRILDVKLDDGRLTATGADTPEAAELRAGRKLEVQVQIETIADDRLDVRIGEVPNV
ncbi:hypothetical protein OM076_11350 [Solirubrobacter ginsenosidimutans]|uniref:Uncharacterized protein n=1 Tax=Solirubrobacter ginsenosidimutans TaxID=490573 RepID=A0A9X3S1B0_9ACTN|nr:hypothetical protein [Solirubrobacter ginsenosidimutans]MDA0160862.1 hypothetical protein [Solirubrobacter ginsenosidimutans]